MSAVQDGTFETVLEKIRTESKNTVEIGTKFEKIIFDFFKTDSVYKKRFQKVWMWGDWARDNKIKEELGTAHDLGVDIVAQEYGGTLCAIQCKCYNDDNILGKEDIDSFIAAGKSYHLSNYVLACTGPINDNAMAMLRGVRCNIITKQHLKNSSIDWSEYPKIKSKKPKKLRDYQQFAMTDVVQGFEKSARGKMIMACGTGKTFVSLKIAEKLVGKGGIVLYLVPSISLILQSMREWSDNSGIPHYYMAVCSDKSIRNSDNGTLTELETPASTDITELSEKLAKMSNNTMNVIFSTYHSIEVVMSAMTDKKFDLILCDEAHRTTGIGDTKNESFLTMVHHERNIKSKRRLYMTATPRIYTDIIKAKAQQKEKVIISMDDESLYGSVFHNLSFYDAVHKYHALSDFKVRVAIMDGDTMSRMIQHSTANDENLVPLNEKTLMASVWHALEYPGSGDEKELLQRVIVFCDMINSSKLFAGEELVYKKDIREDPEKLGKSKEIDRYRSFGKVVEHIQKIKNDHDSVKSEVRHVDGGDNAQRRRRELDWLRDSQDDPSTCRILSNARCLSEGIDVPSLDGVVFMNPRKSVVDVVQAVGRVMRRSPGKEYGYVILPVAIPAGIKVEEALRDSKHFKVVWQVLNALRSHDPNLAEEINRLILERPNPNDNEITNRIIIRHANSHNLYSLDMPADKMIEGITTKLIEKVGDINYFDRYGQKLGEASHTIEARIKNKIDSSDSIKNEIGQFHDSLKKMINDSITIDSTTQVIAQHIVLSRVFDALFQGEFTSHNPISIEFDRVAKKLGLKEELEDLEGFYEDVKTELKEIKSREARQNFIKKIYGNFFESADKKGTEQHGVVYTPVELIDFIINSVQHLLKKHFKTEFNERAVKVLEPFAGTGTFITRLLESGLITDNLYEKYKNDLYANELILLAYYIATVNIETTYSSLRQGGRYVPFDGISYTDTLQINPQYRDDKSHRQNLIPFDGTFKIAHERIRHQRGSHVHVLMGNPPYSKGQSKSSDNNPNIEYPAIKKRIKITYMKKATTHDKKSLYDSYVLSLRWASDRIGESGIIAFVTNGSFIRSETAAGIRACFAEEFNEVWCFDLRGNGRITGDGRNVFEYPGQSSGGSRTPIAIIILVKNPKKSNHVIYYSSLESSYYSGEDKRKRVKELKFITGIKDWQVITPDRHHDWLDPRDDEFLKYVPIGSKAVKSGKETHATFKIFSLGIASHRDVWIYNSSRNELTKNIKCQIQYCNKQDLTNSKLDKKLHDKKQIQWTGGLTQKLIKEKPMFDKDKIRRVLYRPFFKQYHYFDNVFNDAVYLIPRFFPENYSRNLTIIVPYKFTGEFSTFVTDVTPDLEVIHHGQCFPLYTYENKKDKKLNITDFILQEYRGHYKDKKITKKDIFYYTYGMLHHAKYKKKFANNLIRELPNIPMVPDFWLFCEAGEKLIGLHLNFETCKKYDLEPVTKFGKLEKISFPRMKTDLREIDDTTRLKINGVIAFKNIPKISYTVNGKTPLGWMIDRYKFKTDKDSGITNDSTADMTEQKTIDMIQRLIYVGIASDTIISRLSKLPFEPKNWTPVKTGMDAFSDVKNSESEI